MEDIYGGLRYFGFLLELVFGMGFIIRWIFRDGVAPHRYQAKINLYLYNQKNAILFVEIYRKDGVFV
ncbi:hypothetical protein NSQ40_08630 [Bacillus sp. FSL K6-6038]|uniref:hypothetical protein n=1 Tax=Bacillus TaxID=1386 RepID=UPI00215AD7E5|nr:hypothetical protein [Bacillus pseudomycoides]MCR8861029.1 hypothetical protein [Bacillus pseudomycoides]